MRGVAFLAGLLLAVLAGTGLTQAAPAPSAPAALASNVMREPLSGDPTREVVAIAVRLPPRAETGGHSHPGDKYTVVEEGQVRVIVEGFPPKLFKAGEGFHVNPGVVHRYENASSERDARTTEFLIVVKNERTTVPAK